MIDPKELVSELKAKLPEGEKTECTIAGKVIGDINIEGIISITNRRLIFYNDNMMKALEFYEIINMSSALLGGIIKISILSDNVQISNIKAGNSSKFIDLLWQRIPSDRKSPDLMRAIEQESNKLNNMKEKCLIDEVTYNRKRQGLSKITTQPKNIHPKKARIINTIVTLCIALVFILIFNSVYSFVSTVLSYGKIPLTEEKSAYYAAREFIDKRLKVPSSAEYARYDESEVIKTTHDGGYRVTMAVESENSFGAKIRSTFVVRVKKVDDNWIFVDIEESQ